MPNAVASISKHRQVVALCGVLLKEPSPQYQQRGVKGFAGGLSGVGRVIKGWLHTMLCPQRIPGRRTLVCVE
jgi:hypothetical protein